jgi:hypothetical protein
VPLRISFSAACEARIDSAVFMQGLKPPPPSESSFSSACEAKPLFLVEIKINKTGLAA